MATRPVPQPGPDFVGQPFGHRGGGYRDHDEGADAGQGCDDERLRRLRYGQRTVRPGGQSCQAGVLVGRASSAAKGPRCASV